MRKRYRLIFIVILSALFLFGCDSSKDSNKELTIDEKIEDFEYLYDVVKTSYPFLDVNKRMNNVDWLAKKEQYLNLIKDTENDEDYIRVLSNIIKLLNNDHTHLIADQSSFRWIYDLYEDIGWYKFFDNKKVKNRYNIDKESTENKANNYEESNNEKLSASEGLILEEVVEGKVGYIYLPQMYGGEQIEADMKEIKKYLSTVKNNQALIIDIRGNGGGSDMYWQELMTYILPKEYSTSGYILFRDSKVLNSYLRKRKIKGERIDKLSEEVLKNAPEEVSEDFKSFIECSTKISPKKDSIKFEGNIYLLVDRRVYSSSESFAIFCKEEGVATLIGGKTGGDGGGIDPILFNLPNSGLIVRMASDMYITKSGVCDEEFKTTPHYEIEGYTKSSDFKYDACINKVLQLEDIN